MIEEILVSLLYFLSLVAAALLVRNHYRHAKAAPSVRFLTFTPRFWAGLVDGCVLWPVSFLFWLIALLNGAPRLAAFLLIVETLLYVIYTVYMHARFGQTIGKMTTKVRVVDCRSEGAITLGQAWLRDGIPAVVSIGWLGYEILNVMNGGVVGEWGTPRNERLFQISIALPFLWFLLEVITMLTNDKRRALHDYIAGTVVIRTNLREASVAGEPEYEGPINKCGQCGIRLRPRRNDCHWCGWKAPADV